MNCGDFTEIKTIGINMSLARCINCNREKVFPNSFLKKAEEDDVFV